jgi:hypothetical protein
LGRVPNEFQSITSRLEFCCTAVFDPLAEIDPEPATTCPPPGAAIAHVLEAQRAVIKARRTRPMPRGARHAATVPVMVRIP